jgi:hypothetical protein
MGGAARRSFEQDLTLEAFGRRFMTVVSEQIASGVGRAGVQARTPTDAASKMANSR